MYIYQQKQIFTVHLNLDTYVHTYVYISIQMQIYVYFLYNPEFIWANHMYTIHITFFHTYLWIYILKDTFVGACICSCKCVYLQIHMCKYSHVCMFVHIFHIFLDTHTYSIIYSHVCTNKDIRMARNCTLFTAWLDFRVWGNPVYVNWDPAPATLTAGFLW